MVKKLKTLAKTDDKQLAEAVRTSAHQIWQAGLGAFAKAQEEGGKVFAKLVKEGTDLQKRTQKMAEIKVSGVTGSVTKMADNVSKQASGSWDKLEQVFEDRVSRSLTSLGVPSKKDIQSLTKRVEELSKAVATLSGKKPSAVKESAKPAAKKPAAKKAVAKAPSKAAPKAAPKTASKTAGKAAPKTAPKAVAKKPAAKAVAAKKPAAAKKGATKAVAKPVAATPAEKTNSAVAASANSTEN
jgi:poly(hydroxyalkanoate) granule-associated protein